MYIIKNQQIEKFWSEKTNDWATIDNCTIYRNGNASNLLTERLKTFNNNSDVKVLVLIPKEIYEEISVDYS